MTESQGLIITSLGISKTAAELINQRVFDVSQVTLVGQVSVSESGEAFSFNTDSYVSHTGIELSNAENIRIKFAGTFISNAADTLQCCWSLVNPSLSSDDISLCINSGSIVILKGSSQEFVISDLNFSLNDSVDIDFTLSRTSYSIIVKHNSGVYTFNGTWTSPIGFSIYKGLTIGWTINNSDYYWNNNINLNNFVLYKDNILYYSSSKDSIINFSKIMISDGTYSLTDTSSPILDHVYEIPIIDKSKTANTITIKSKIDENTYLKISEIGLYAQIEDGTSILFGIVRGLTVNKTSGLDYNLIFRIDLSISIVNALIAPNIVIQDSDFVSLNDILNLERVYTNVITDLERAITNNAKMIGYAHPLSVNAFMNLNNECQRNVVAVEGYKNLRRNILAPIEDFYAFCDFPYVYSVYYAYNLSGLPQSSIRCLEGALTGKQDSINFNSENGFTLAVNTQLKDPEDKIIIAKIDSLNNPYITLEFKDFSLIFKLYNSNEVITLSKTFETFDFQKIMKNDYLVTIVFSIEEDVSKFKMYGGTELLEEIIIDTIVFEDPSLYKITNYLNSSVLPEENYVKNIVSFKGALSSSDIMFLNTVLGSNT